MRYFIYVSLSKIEMLHAQIEQEASESESSFGFDIKVLKGELKEKSKPADNTYKRLERVVAALKKIDVVGDLNSEKPYVYQTLVMKFGDYGDHYAKEKSPIAIWASQNDEGPFEGTTVVLAGSSYHLIGEQRGDGSAHSHSLTPAMMLWFQNNLGDEFSKSQREALGRENLYARDEKLEENVLAHATHLAASQMRGQSAKYEFLAKVLHRSQWPEFRSSKVTKIILGSPLYVCLAD